MPLVLSPVLTVSEEPQKDAAETPAAEAPNAADVAEAIVELLMAALEK